jgi:hypothetical protein
LDLRLSKHSRLRRLKIYCKFNSFRLLHRSLRYERYLHAEYRSLSIDRLQAVLGDSAGLFVWEIARGIDEAEGKTLSRLHCLNNHITHFVSWNTNS